MRASGSFLFRRSRISYCDLCCAESVFAEACVLDLAVVVFVAEFFGDCFPEYSFAFSVDEYYFLSFLFLVLLHYFAEVVELDLEHVAV